MIFIIQNLHGRPVFRIMSVPAARIKEHSACGKYSMRACISLLCTFSGVIFEEMAAVSWRFQWSGLSQQRVWKYHPSWKQTKGDLRQAVIAADFWLEQGNCLYQPFFVSRVFFIIAFLVVFLPYMNMIFLILLKHTRNLAAQDSLLSCTISLFLSVVSLLQLQGHNNPRWWLFCEQSGWLNILLNAVLKAWHS